MGMGIGPRTAAAIKKIVPLCNKIVRDAAALMPGYPLKGIVTPHHNEFMRISGIKTSKDPIENTALAKEFSAKTGIVTVIKGPVDVISDGSRIGYCNLGNPGMTVSGTGDVLAGIIGALYCKNEPFEAACTGAFLNGAAGVMAFEEKGFGLLSTDIIEMIPYVLKKNHPSFTKQLKVRAGRYR